MTATQKLASKPTKQCRIYYLNLGKEIPAQNTTLLLNVIPTAF